MNTIQTFLPWLMSCVTITSLWLQGNKWPYAWLITLGNQALWLTWIVTIEAWGLLPMTAAICFVAVRNHARWSQSLPGEEGEK